MASKNDERRPHDGNLTLDVSAAAEYLLTSKSNLRRRFINTGLVQLIDLGGSSPHILRSQLDEAVRKIAAAQAADPSLFKPRSGGAILKARGVIGNKWGRHGKPPEPKPKTGKRA
jgi:hypothetical protein